MGYVHVSIHASVGSYSFRRIVSQVYVTCSISTEGWQAGILIKVNTSEFLSAGQDKSVSFTDMSLLWGKFRVGTEGSGGGMEKESTGRGNWNRESISGLRDKSNVKYFSIHSA